MSRTAHPDRWIRLRALGFCLFLAAIFCTIAYRAYRLQIVEGPRLRKLAEQQYLKQVTLAPRRGTLSDRHGEPLAVSVEVESVAANPRVVKRRAPQYAARLAEILDLDRAKLERLLGSRRYFVWIKRRISAERARRVKSLKLQGISLVKENRRFYPNRQLAGPLIGFAGMDGVGLEGVELGLDKWLRGSPVTTPSLRDALGRRLLSRSFAVQLAGHRIVLTIDKFIQYQTELALKHAYDQVDPETGWLAAVVMQPHSGEILAMATVPGFDPNRFGQAGPRYWRNRTIADAFEPGSTLKLFTVAGALKHGLTRPNEKIDCESGRWKIGRHTIHDSKRHRNLRLADILKKSSNVGVAKLAFRLGEARLYKTLRRFGFGEQTGIELPGERTGVVPDFRRWSSVRLANIGFGQGMTATVLQLARALSVFGNGGRLMEPRLVLRIEDTTGNIVRKYEPAGRRIISQQLSKQVLQLIRGVTEQGGTGEDAALERYTVAGKTGTAQKIDPLSGSYADDKWISSFVGLAPASNPRLAIVVVANDPIGDKHYGGEFAGPLFKQIASQALRYLGVPSD